MGAPVTVEELEIVIRAKVGEALANMQQVINRMEKLINQQIPQLQPKLDAAMQKADRVIDRDADKIIASIDRLADAQTDLNKRLEQTADRYDEALDNAQEFLGGVLEGMAEGMEEVARNTDQAGKKTEQYGKKAEQVTRKAGKNYNWLTGQIRGMIVSMALYGVIDLFTTSVSTAATEMAKLDEETNKMLSSYKSSFEYAQMSFGTAMLPLLEAAEPLVTSLADGFAEVSNYIGMFFAALNGQTQYNKVVKKTADFLEDTADAAEEVKRSIAGFDELNIIGQEEETSGWETELVDIPQWMQTLGKYIDAETLAMAALTAGTGLLLGKVIDLKKGMLEKNDALDKQTKKTKTDAEAVKELAESFVPALLEAGDLTQALVSLGSLSILPTIDLSLFDESTGRMLESIDLGAERLDELGLLRPAPQMDTAPMLESADEVEQRITELDEVEPAQKIMPEIDRESEFDPSAQDITQTVDDLNSLEFEQMVFKAIETTGLQTSVGEISSLLSEIAQDIAETINAYNQLQQAIGGSGVSVSQPSSGKQLEWMAEESSANNIVMQSGITAIRTAAAQKSTAEAIQNANEFAEEAAKAAEEAAKAAAKAAESTAETKINPDLYQSIISSPVGQLVANPYDTHGGRYNQAEITASELESAIDAVGTTAKYGAKIAVDLAASALGGAIAGIAAEAVQSSGSKAMDVLNDAIGNANAQTTADDIVKVVVDEGAITEIVNKFKKLPNAMRGGSIPQMANGGVAFSNMLANIGEYPGVAMNPEIVAPQNLIYDTVVQANGELVSAMHSMIREVIAAIENNASGDVYLDSRKITGSVIEGIKAEKRRTGKSPI